MAKPLSFQTRLLGQRSFVGLLWFCLLLATSFNTRSEVMILLHGHQGSSIDFRISGFNDVLKNGGWHDGGEIDTVENTADLKPPRGRDHDDSFYTIDLPSQAALTAQASRLDAALKQILPRHPRSELIFTGFSAGGVVARLYIVRHPQLTIRALCTIAAPHLGAESAEIALLAAESPLSEYASQLGMAFITQSQALYKDLVPERPGSFLYKLNREPHPAARYVAIVRVNTEAEPGDLVVSASSQDMNNVVALHGKVTTLTTPGVHGVLADDARRILQTLTSAPH